MQFSFIMVIRYVIKILYNGEDGRDTASHTAYGSRLFPLTLASPASSGGFLLFCPRRYGILEKSLLEACGARVAIRDGDTRSSGLRVPSLGLDSRFVACTRGSVFNDVERKGVEDSRGISLSS